MQLDSVFPLLPDEQPQTVRISFETTLMMITQVTFSRALPLKAHETRSFPFQSPVVILAESAEI